MEKKIVATAVACRVLIVIHFYVDFSLGKRKVERFCRCSRVERIRDTGAAELRRLYSPRLTAKAFRTFCC
jgi:hypothetical protein